MARKSREHKRCKFDVDTHVNCNGYHGVVTDVVYARGTNRRVSGRVVRLARGSVEVSPSDLKYWKKGKRKYR